ncbi:MAG: hypothetical protein ACI4BH_11785 [Muribaculaceae bacterium]
MRKFYMFLMSMMLFSFVASAQTTVVVNLDSKDRAYVEMNYSEIPNLVDGDNTFEVPQYGNFYIKSRPGYFLSKVVKKSTGTEENITGMTQCYIYPNAADTWTVTSVTPEQVRTEKCQVKVDNAEKVQVLLSNTYSVVNLTSGEFVDVPYVPGVENQLMISPANYGEVLNKVLLNGEEVQPSGTTYYVNIKNGDQVEVVSKFEDKDCNVDFIYVGEDITGIVKSVTVNNETVTNFNDEDFTVKAGKTMYITFDAQTYKLDGLKINDESVYAGTSYQFVVKDDTKIEITGHRYAEVTATLNIDDASRVLVARGYSYSTDYFEGLVNGENTIKVSEAAPQIYISAKTGANIKKVVAGGNEISADYSGGYSITVTEGMEITVETSALERNATLNVYLGVDPSTLTFFSMTRADRSEVELVKGWNEIKFGEDLSIDNPFSWSWYDSNQTTQFGVVKLNDVVLTPLYANSVSYSASFKDGDKLVICPSSDVDSSSIRAIVADGEEMPEFVFTITGQKVKSDNLPAGLYIINGKKVVIR